MKKVNDVRVLENVITAFVDNADQIFESTLMKESKDSGAKIEGHESVQMLDEGLFEEKLLNKLTYNLKSFDVIAEGLKFHNMLPESLSERKKNLLIVSYFNRIRIIMPDYFQFRNPVHQWELTFRSTTLEETKKIEKLIVWIAEKANKNLDDEIMHEIETIMYQPVIDYLKIRSQTLSRLAKYEKSQVVNAFNLDLNYLKVQRNIAKNLDILKPLEIPELKSSQSGSNENLELLDSEYEIISRNIERVSQETKSSLELDFFLFGYEILDKMIDELIEEKDIIINRSLEQKYHNLLKLNTIYDFDENLAKEFNSKADNIKSHSFFPFVRSSVRTYETYDNNVYIIMPYLIFIIINLLTLFVISIINYRKKI